MLDLASLAAVRQFALEFSAGNRPPLRALVCNAGVQHVGPTQRTQDGFESTFGVNHLGHFLLANLMLRHLVAPGRIIFVSSGTHDPSQRTGMPAPLLRHARSLAAPDDEEEARRHPSFVGRRRYTTSKLCNVLCTYEMDRLLKNCGTSTPDHPITVNAFDPGAMPGTGLVRGYGPAARFAWNALGTLLRWTLRPFNANIHRPEDSGRALARLVLDPALESVSGRYFEGLMEIRSSAESYDEEKAAPLWELSAELVGLRTSWGLSTPRYGYARLSCCIDGSTEAIRQHWFSQLYHPFDHVKGAIMRYRLLGKSGLRVSELCLGTMTFGEDWGWGSSKDESRQILDAFFEAGGNFIDTANVYTNGTSETLLGEFLKGDRDRAVLATKFTNAMPGTDPNAGGNQRKNMMRAVEASLKRLQTDYIDLYWLHIWDKITPLDEVMRAFDDLVRQGKILHAGVSDMAAWAVARANTLAELRGWTPFVGLQIEYSLIERTVERELIPMAEEMGLGVTAWSPLAGGVLTGKYAEGKAEADARMNNEMMKSFNRADERARTVVAEVQTVAREVGRSPAQVALAWLRHRPVPVIPIVGARRLAQFRDNLACLDLTLNERASRSSGCGEPCRIGLPARLLRQGYGEGARLRWAERQDRRVN